MRGLLPLLGGGLGILSGCLVPTGGDPGAAHDKAIVGPTDDRVEPYDPRVTDPVREAARSTAVLVRGAPRDAVGPVTFQSAPLDARVQATFDAPLCGEERFADQPTLGTCSAFLVAPDVMATAAHCASQAHCADISFVFDYAYTAEGEPADLLTVAPENLYHCERVIAGELAGDKDHALVKLDRVVEGRPPLELDSSSLLLSQPPLLGIGHPHGLPQKILLDGQISLWSFLRLRQADVLAAMDVVGGNSGGAVFDAETMKVVALVRGAIDEGGYEVVNAETPAADCVQTRIWDPPYGGSILSIVDPFEPIVDALNGPYEIRGAGVENLDALIDDDGFLDLALDEARHSGTPVGPIVAAYYEFEVTYEDASTLMFMVGAPEYGWHELAPPPEAAGKRVRFRGQLEFAKGTSAPDGWAFGASRLAGTPEGIVHRWSVTTIHRLPE